MTNTQTLAGTPEVDQPTSNQTHLDEKLPTPAEESSFWSLIDLAWEHVSPETQAFRQALLRHEAGNVIDAVNEPFREFIHTLSSLTEEMTSDELTSLDRVLERKLYDIDRADIHRVTSGTDDGFLYLRGFIVAMGKDFYNAVNLSPKVAEPYPDADCEDMCYLFAQLHDDRFGRFPDTDSGICRETGSNITKWGRG